MSPSQEVETFNQLREAAWRSGVTPESLLGDIRELDPREALESLGLLMDWLSQQEDELVLKCIIEGASWSEIGVKLGRSKQAVWQKHRVGPEDPPPGRPVRSPRAGLRAVKGGQ